MDRSAGDKIELLDNHVKQYCKRNYARIDDYSVVNAAYTIQYTRFGLNFKCQQKLK